MSLSLRLLGGAGVMGTEGPTKGPLAQRHRVALLATLAAAHPRSVGRDKLMALLWPERDVDHARVLLNQSVHVIRRAAGDEAIVTVGDDLRLDAALLRCDIIDFDEAIAVGDRERAVDMYAGPFLDGFFLSESVEFERWVDRQRARLATAFAGAVDALAEAAARSGDVRAEVRWWTLRSHHDPLDSGVARRLMDAMERAGNRAGAVQHGRTHQELLARELDIEPDPGIDALIERLRRETVAAPVDSTTVLVNTPVVAGMTTIPVGAPQAPARVAPRHVRLRWAGFAAVVVLLLVVVRLSMGAGQTVATPAVVDEIAQAVARELSRRDRGEPGPVPREQRTRSLAAYEAFLRGNDPILLRSDSGARRGLAYFQRAVELDSGYAAAWAGVARMSNRASGNSREGRGRALAVSEAAARKAIALDDSLADAHATLAFTRLHRGDLAGAEANLRRAIALEPEAARYRESLVRLYAWWERPADALAEAKKAIELAPLSPTANAEMARALFVSGRPQEALRQLERVGQLDPPLLRAATIAAQCLDQEERFAEAASVLRPSAESGQTLSTGLYGYLLARAGQADSARRLVAALERVNENALNIGLVHAGLGDFDGAMRWFDRAIDDQSMRFASELGPSLKRILRTHRSDPRVTALRRRIGLEPMLP